EALREITENEYTPNGGTALCDAIGHTITKLCETTDPSNEYNSYLVIVISDGEELNSVKWTQQQVAEKIKQLESTNRWTFTYIGSTRDIAKMSQSLGLNSRNTLSGFEGGNEAMTTNAFTTNAQQMKKFLDGKLSCPKNYSVDDYYEQGDK